MSDEQKRAFVVPAPDRAPKHEGLYIHDHHIVRVRDKDANLLEVHEHEALGDTAESAADWALEQGYIVFIFKDNLARNGVKPDPKDSSQWRSYTKADQIKNNRRTLENL